MKGFILIELIIVLIIIGVLAAIAIPGYCNYIVPARVAKTLASAEPLKKVIAQHYQTHKFMPTALAINLNPSKQDDLESVGYLRYATHSAAIVYKFNQKLTGIPAVADHKTLILRVSADANAKLSWDCYGGDLPGRHRPKVCRLEDNQP